VPANAPHSNQANFAQHAKMLWDRRLIRRQRHDNLANRLFPVR
jgi:hypothetical protein